MPSMDFWIVVGWGKPRSNALRSANREPWTWAIAQLLAGLTEPMQDLVDGKVAERWCVVVPAALVSEHELRADGAVIGFHTLPFPALALAAAAGDVQVDAQGALDFDA